MRTIYIKGKGQYKRNVRKALSKTDYLIEGYDFVEGLDGSDFMLIWLREGIDERLLKLGITAKYVWKHRLNFFNSIEEMNPPKKDEKIVSVFDDLKRLEAELK
jgi:hypothetical protein